MTTANGVVTTANTTIGLFIKSMQACGYETGDIYKTLEEIGERHGINIYTLLNNNILEFQYNRLTDDDILFLLELKKKRQLGTFAKFAGITDRTIRNMMKKKRITQETWEKFVVARSDWECKNEERRAL